MNLSFKDNQAQSSISQHQVYDLDGKSSVVHSKSYIAAVSERNPSGS